MIRYFFLILTLASCAKETTSEETTRKQVQVFLTKKMDVPIFFETTGIVTPYQTVAISSQLEGEITGIYFKEGEPVREGDLLFTLDPTYYKEKVKQSKGKLEEIVYSFQLAKEKMLRMQQLVDSDYISQVDFDTQVAEMKQHQAAITQAEAALEMAQTSLSRCWIYAPIDGVIGFSKVYQGTVLHDESPQTLAVINQVHPIYITFSFPEGKLPIIREKMSQKNLKVISFLDHHNKELSGHIDMIDNQIDPKSSLVQARALFDNYNKLLWPNQKVSVKVILDQKKEQIAIPAHAIIYEKNKSYVLTVSPKNIVEKQEITLGEQSGSMVIVHQLEDNSEVILSPKDVRVKDHVVVTY
jgi:membrane fusion protein, multidrug efflux system